MFSFQSYRYLIVFIAYLTFGLSLAQADTRQNWSITEIAGTVVIKDASGQEMKNAQTGLKLALSVAVTTGNDGRLVLEHGDDHLTVGPDTNFTIPPPKKSATGLITRITQTLGSILYQVEHRMSGGFEVETPYLVSVVKGTTFNIHVTLDTSTVVLMEGRVWVHTPDEKLQLILEPGQAAIKSESSDKILLKDQQSQSRPVTGPIRVVDGTSVGGESQNGLESETGIRLEFNAPKMVSGTDILNSPVTAELDLDGSAINSLLNTGAVSVDIGDPSISRSEVAINSVDAPTIDLNDISIDLADTSIGGGVIDVGVTSIDIDQASVSLDATPTVDLAETSISVGQVSLGEIATPTVDVEAALSVDTSTGVESSLDIGIADTSIASVDVGATSIVIDQASVSLDATPAVDIGETSISVGEVSLGEIATPTVDVEATLSIDTSTGVDSSLDLGVADTSIASVDVSGTTKVDSSLLDDVVTTVTNTATDVVDTSGSVLGDVVNKLPGL